MDDEGFDYEDVFGGVEGAGDDAEEVGCERGHDYSLRRLVMDTLADRRGNIAILYSIMFVARGEDAWRPPAMSRSWSRVAEQSVRDSRDDGNCNRRELKMSRGAMG